MKRIDLLEQCRMLAGAGVWCIPESTLIACAGYPDLRSFRVSLSRHCKSGIIKRIASKLYENPYLRPPAFGLYRLANFLRPDDDFYLSAESVLSECGRISQMPFCLIFVTTGRSYRYSTSMGDILFTRTTEDPGAWCTRTHYNQARQIWEATPEKALEDLRRYGRNLDLVLPEDEWE